MCFTKILLQSSGSQWLHDRFLSFLAHPRREKFSRMSSNDVNMQKAIFASLQSSRPPPAASRPLPATRTSFTSTFAPPRSSTVPRRTALPSDSIGSAKKPGGRVDSLSREGISPIPRSQASSGQATASARGGGASLKHDGRVATSNSASRRPGQPFPKPAAATSPQKGPGGSKQKQEPDGGAKKESAEASMERTYPKYEGGDDPKFVEAIERDILATKLGTKWGDIAKLEDAKRLLQEAVVLPLLMPELYVGIRQPWKGVLLFGPPGTGKTLLARAVASEAQTTFFNVSASTLISKYLGESEKLTRTLFGMARHYAPSTVFFDEIDGLMSQRGAQAEHEASRRLKGEILSQMDGIANAAAESERSAEHPSLVMVLATTNKPWDLDEALRRRLEKRIYIPLPGDDARLEMIRLFLSTVQCSDDVDLGTVANDTKGFSGADLHILCREASMAPMRRMTSQHGAAEMVRLKQEGKLDLKVRMADIVDALKHTQSSVCSKDLEKYVMWEKEFANN